MFVSVAAAMVWLIGLDNIRRMLNGVVAGAGPRAQRPAAGAGGEAAGGANPRQQQRPQPPPQAQPRGFLRSLQAVVVSFFTSLVVGGHLVVGYPPAVWCSSHVVGLHLHKRCGEHSSAGPHSGAELRDTALIERSQHFPLLNEQAGCILGCWVLLTSFCWAILTVGTHTQQHSNGPSDTALDARPAVQGHPVLHNS